MWAADKPAVLEVVDQVEYDGGSMESGEQAKENKKVGE